MYKHESFQEDLFESKQLSQKTELKKNALESIKKQTRDEIDSLKKAVSTTSKDKEWPVNWYGTQIRFWDVYQGHFKNWLRDWHGTLERKDHTKYVWNWKEDLESWSWTANYPKSWPYRTYAWQWERGKWNWYWNLYYSDISRYAWDFKEGERHGKGFLHDRNDVVFSWEWENDVFQSGVIDFSNSKEFKNSREPLTLVKQEWCVEAHSFSVVLVFREESDGFHLLPENPKLVIPASLGRDKMYNALHVLNFIVSQARSRSRTLHEIKEFDSEGDSLQVKWTGPNFDTTYLKDTKKYLGVWAKEVEKWLDKNWVNMVEFNSFIPDYYKKILDKAIS